MTPRLSRRTLLATGTTSILAAYGLTHLSQPARAGIQTQGLTVRDGDYQSPTSGPSDVRIQVSGSFEYVTNRLPDDWRVRLHVSSNTEDWELIAADGGPASGREMTGDYGVRGSLLGHSAFDAGMFRVDSVGGSVEHRVYVRVTLGVLTESEDVLVGASAADDAYVRVSRSGVEASGSVSGSGGVEFED